MTPGKRPPARPAGGRPPFRAQYGAGIRALLSHVPATALEDKWTHNTYRFLLKLADYLESEQYAARSSKALEAKHDWKEKQS